VWRVAVRRGFIHQTLALQDAEAMLLVNGHKTETSEIHVVLDQRVRADDQLRLSAMDTFKGRSFFGALQSADQQLHAIPRLRQNAPRGKKMLHGKNFRRRHQRGLRAVFDGNDRRLQRDDGLAAADVALQQPVHRRGLFQVRGDFGEYALLCRRRLERQDTLQRFTHRVFANAKRDGIFLACRPPVQREAELI
jgi:hypothetical protein